MTTIKRFSFALATTFFLFSISARAQTPTVSTVNVKAEADRVLISAEGGVSEMRVDVADESGDIVFQSGAGAGDQLDWKMTDGRGERVPPGTYLVTVTFRTPAGKLRKRVEQVTVEEALTTSSSQPTPGPAPAATTSPVPVKASGSVTAGRLPKFTSLSASVATVADSAVFDNAGKVGIGTAAPTSLLTVAGTAGNVPAVLSTNNASGGIAVKGATNNVTGVGLWGLHAATIGTTPGVKGETNSPAENAVGVLGLANAANPSHNTIAVRGTNKSTSGFGTGVYGEQAGNGVGVYGTTPTGYGVAGFTNSSTGEGVGAGVAGFSTSSGDGVYGTSAGGVGVDGAGVTGVLGSGSSFGVYGDGQNSGVGVYGRSLAGYAGLFEGHVRITSIPNTNGTDTGDVCFNPQGDLMNCRASSLRYKTNVQTFRGGLEIVRRLRPISFNWKESGVSDIGLAAEQVVEVAPVLASTNEGEVVGVKYSRLNVLLINAVKEQQREIEQQARRSAEQARQIKRLQAQLNQVRRSARKRAAHR